MCILSVFNILIYYNAKIYATIAIWGKETRFSETRLVYVDVYVENAKMKAKTLKVETKINVYYKSFELLRYQNAKKHGKHTILENKTT